MNEPVIQEEPQSGFTAEIHEGSIEIDGFKITFHRTSHSRWYWFLQDEDCELYLECSTSHDSLRIARESAAEWLGVSFDSEEVV